MSLRDEDTSSESRLNLGPGAALQGLQLLIWILGRPHRQVYSIYSAKGFRVFRYSVVLPLTIMSLTMAMTAAPAPASAHTNRWKVKSSCETHTQNTKVSEKKEPSVFCLSYTFRTKYLLRPARYFCILLPHWICTSC